ncbi:MAG: hypothetical protein AAGG65_19270 [Pseudomonadota bacterium]
MHHRFWLLIAVALIAWPATAQPPSVVASCASAAANASAADHVSIVQGCSEIIDEEGDDTALAARIIRGESFLELGEYESALADFDRILEDWDSDGLQALGDEFRKAIGMTEIFEPEMTTADAVDWFLMGLYALRADIYCALDDPESAAENEIQSLHVQYGLFRRLQPVDSEAVSPSELVSAEDELAIRQRFERNCPAAMTAPPPPAPVIAPVQ